ncbi:MAG: ThiF family adenylyltransferase [Planctomycetes bacterium]|nr:ThiF family adenylyltransferase [Planctomycetota bacterium]
MGQQIKCNPMPDDVRRLRAMRVALPGLGGVGGGHAQVLAEMGVGAFHLADFDTFDLVNFNRQLGATMSSLGRLKADVTGELIRKTNPAAEVTLFRDGIQPENIGAFLKNVDVVVDGIEFFAIGVRRMLYKASRERRIPVIHAGPIGYGATVLVFAPDGPSFDEYFRIDDRMTRAEMLAAHALGHGTGFKSDLDPSRVDFHKRTGPALAPACMFCSALAAQEVLRLARGEPFQATAPRNGCYVDLFYGRVLPLRPKPSLTRTLRGRLLRRIIFRRMPGLRELHETELLQRNATLA